MPQRKPYNPYTKYGKRKIREQAQIEYNNYTPEEKQEFDKTNFGCNVLLFVIFISICIVIFLVSGPEALIKWLK